MTRITTLPAIAKRIYVLRGHRVIVSTDLAALYEVDPKVLVQAVKRNLSRFPEDFMFRLSEDEWGRLGSRSGGTNLKSQTVTSSWGGARKPPYAFTEQGVAMLSSVLSSKRAVQVNIEIMRAFVRLRQWLISNKELALKLSDLEKKHDLKFTEYDGHFKLVFEAINQLLAPPSPPRKLLGFQPPRPKR